MRDREQDLDVLVDGTERLGVVGSPSSTSQLALDILGAAVTRKLVGELALFRFLQDGAQHYALGQITRKSADGTFDTVAYELSPAT